MPKTYATAENVEKVAQGLISNFHPELATARIKYVFVDVASMKNGRPVQLFPLLAAIGHPLAADQRAFEERYCQGHWLERGGKRQWQAMGATHLEELQRLTRPLVLHRRKQDCLDLPPKQRRLAAPST